MARYFINRPIVAIVIAIVMVIVGVVALLGLPIAQYPNIVPPEIFINTTYVGADAQTVEQSVSTPIEQEMSGVDNMNYMYSLNANNGELKLYVNFDVKTDPNVDQVLRFFKILAEGVGRFEGFVDKFTGDGIMALFGAPLAHEDHALRACYAPLDMQQQVKRYAGRRATSTA